MKLILTFLALTILGIPVSHAFKIDTHVWIAYQILEEVRTHQSIDIPLEGQYRGNKKALRINVDKRVVSALSKHPQNFLIGSIGPDALPGIFSGQLTIHPGVTGRWSTSRWLEHISNRATTEDELAFALGYLSHAASDVFAHTYVNSYSGDHWELKGENAVERRHFVLEGYIANKTPPFGINSRGQSVRQLLQTGDQLHPPLAWIRSNLVLDPIASKQYRGTADHLRELYNLTTEIDSLTAENGRLREIQDLIEKIVASMYLNIETSKKQRKWIREQRQKLNNLQMDVADEVKKAQHQVNDFHKDVNDFKSKALSDHLENLEGAVEGIQELLDQKHDFEEQLIDARDKFWSEKDKIDKKICKELKFSLGARLICKVKSIVNPNKLKLKKIWEAKRDAELKATGQLKTSIVDFRNATQKFYAAYNEALDTKQELNDAAIDMFKLTKADTFILIAYLKSWRNAIDESVETYALANLETMVRTLEADAEVMEPINLWVSCDLPKAVGLPAPAVDGVCAGSNGIQSIILKIDEMLADLTHAIPLVGKLHAELQKLKQQIKDSVKQELQQAFLNALGPEVRSLVDIMSLKPDGDSLRQEFGRDRSSSGLLVIPDIEARVLRDMGLKRARTPHFDPESFPPVYNAILLSKLSLLDATELNAVASYFGMSESTCYPSGNPLYPSNRLDKGIVLFDWINSIDGNHQWLSPQPPHPRSNGQNAQRDSYAEKWTATKENGFRFWVDPQMRSTFFGKIFIGPIAPGIEFPEGKSHKMTRILPSNFPYAVSSDIPYPLYSNTACDSSTSRLD